MSETTYTVIDHDRENRKEFDDEDDAKNAAATAREFGSDHVEIRAPNDNRPDGAETDGGAAEVVETPADDPRDVTPVEPADLSENPIAFLKSVNSDFVNTIKGTPAISKRGFRFIQREFEISTESEIVEFSEDPIGCVVWAKAELPSGYSAEAHGEGWQFESDVSDNEFVRYADTRAKNRAISDLTSAGALAVSELRNEVDR